MWERLLGINTFFIWPATGVLLIYALGRLYLGGEWKLFLMALGIFVLATITEAVLGILSN